MRKSVFFKIIPILSLFFSLNLLAATIQVTTTDDEYDAVPPPGSACSLREAIQSVNDGGVFGGCVDSNGSGFSNSNTIVLQAQTYNLTRVGSEENNVTGDLDINNNGVTILGQAGPATIISAQGLTDNGQPDRVFDINTPGIDVLFSDFTITRGLLASTDGGGVQNLGNATLQEVILFENQAEDGGAIDNQGSMLIMDSTLQSNTSQEDGGAIENDNGELSIQGSVFFQNTAGFSGGAIICDGGELMVQNSVFSENGATQLGGAIFSNLEDAEIPSVLISDTTFEGNEASGGGALNIQLGEFLIYNTTFSGNSSVPGLMLPGFGGAITFQAGELLMTNSTISGNQANAEGGGLFIPFRLPPPGPDLKLGTNSFSEVELFNCTVAENEASTGGGISVGGGGPGPSQKLGPIASSPLTLFNTLVASNQASSSGPDCSGPINSGFFNLIGDATDCGFTGSDGVNGDQVGGNGNPAINPVLSPLQDNGGPTETQALLVGSPAIDAANSAGCMAPDPNNPTDLIDLTEDQRHFPRPVDALGTGTPRCDIGAIEFGVADLTVVKDDDVDPSVAVGQSFTYTITVGNNGPSPALAVEMSDPIPSELSINSVTISSGSCGESGNTVTCNLDQVDVGEVITITINVTVVASNADGSVTNTATVSSTTQDSQEANNVASVVTILIASGNLEGGGCSLGSGTSPLALSQLLWFLPIILFVRVRRGF